MAEDEEEYFFEDDDGNAYADDDYGVMEEQGSGGGSAGMPRWESNLENKYANAKSILDSNPTNALRLFNEAIQEDEDKGRWTFKCYKMIARTYQRAGRSDKSQYKEMADAFGKMIHFQYPALQRADKEKAITKFLDRCAQVPVDIMTNLVLPVALAYLESPQQNMEKLWSVVKLRMVNGQVAARKWEDALQALNSLLVWVKDDEFQRKGTQLVQVYAVLLQVYSETHQSSLVRDTYNTAVKAMNAAITPPRSAAIIHEYGGKYFMRLGLWTDATDAFNQAFRSYDEAGDSQRLACLRYLVLCSMMSKSPVDHLASSETRTYANAPEVECMTRLIGASDRNDLKLFLSILKEERVMTILQQDTFLNMYLQPLLLKVRQQVLLVFAKLFSQVRVSRVASQLELSESAAHSLIMSSILDGLLEGDLDEATGILHLSPLSKEEEKRKAAFETIVEWNALLNQQHEQLRAQCWA